MSGTLTYVVEDGSLIPLDANGRFTLRIDAGTSNAAAYAKEATPAEGSENAAPVVNESNLTNYWQFEEISAQITVDTPSSGSQPAATP